MMIESTHSNAISNGTQEHAVQHILQGILQDDVLMDALVQETPIAFEFNGISHAVMMATPTDLEDFAIGFAYSEGIITAPNQIHAVDINTNDAGITLTIDLASSCFAQLKEKRRTLVGRTGCGICGVESLAHIQNTQTQLPDVKQNDTQAFDFNYLSKAMNQFDSYQPMRDKTGATHAAAWFDDCANLKILREDVGRHNALDKLIGAMLKASISPTKGFILVSSRASYEMVQKTLTLGATTLVSVSAPTSLAVELAQKHKLSLIGFIRGQRAVKYT